MYVRVSVINILQKSIMDGKPNLVFLFDIVLECNLMNFFLKKVLIVCHRVTQKYFNTLRSIRKFIVGEINNLILIPSLLIYPSKNT